MSILKKILKEIEKVANEHPYKVPGKPETYGSYNEAWQDCSDRISGMITGMMEDEKSSDDGWIPVDERMPKCEEEVWIITERGTQTSAMYEDGTMLDKNSAWNWTDINGEWDEQEDCMIIPEGWWEYRHFNPDDVYNNTVDEKVIAWQPLPAPCRPKEEDDV